jgi:hypothetical protein
VGWAERVYVVEREDMLVLEDFVARHLAAQNAREDVRVVIWLCCIDWHRKRLSA